MVRAITSLMLVFSLAGAGLCQSVTLPRATAPLLLCDLGNPETLDLWTGLPITETVLGERPAIQVVFPRYEAGSEEWPSLAVTYQDGKGLKVTDWSHYGKIALDVETDAEDNSGLSLELRSKAHRNGWSKHFTLKAGQVNRLELPLEEVGPEADLTHIEEIVLFVARPQAGYAVTVANIRLLPGDKPPAVAIDLAYPNYRQSVFPNVDRVTITLTPHLEEYGLTADQLTVTVRCSGGEKTARATEVVGGARALSLSMSGIPAGPVELQVDVAGPKGEKLSSAAWSLQKLSETEVQGLRVYIDQDNNAVVDGSPFFPLGWYAGGKTEQMEEIADSPFNCILDYGANYKSLTKMLPYLDEMQRRGLKLIYCCNDVYPGASYIKSWEGIEGNQAIADGVVQAYRDHPALLGWYLNDELPAAMAPELTGYYQRFRELDPNHPCLIVLSNPSDLRTFPETTDVMGVDLYPIPARPVSAVAEMVDKASAAVGGHKPVWMVVQAFAWYQYHPTGSNRGRIPTAEELKSGRAPTYDEERCMTYLALAHGAKGLIYYCYYDLRVLPQYEEMWGWMKRIGAEVKALSPMLLSPEDLGAAAFLPADAPIHTKVKRWNGREYLIAVNAGSEPCEVTFNLGHKLPLQVPVLFEAGSLASDGSRLSVGFRPFEAHVIDLGGSYH